MKMTIFNQVGDSVVGLDDSGPLDVGSIEFALNQRLWFIKELHYRQISNNFDAPISMAKYEVFDGQTRLGSLKVVCTGNNEVNKKEW